MVENQIVKYSVDLGTVEYPIAIRINVSPVWTVYKHTNKINGKGYIGITSQSLQHRTSGKGNGYKNQLVFGGAIKKYGWDNFRHEILLTGLTKEQASIMEKYYINKYETHISKGKGYNWQYGGLIGGNYNKQKPETIDKRSRKIICLNTKTIFPSTAEASKYCGSNASSITRCCQTYGGYQTGHPRYHAGKNPINNEWLAWMYLDEYSNLSELEKTEKTNMSKYLTEFPCNRQIICINSLEIFDGASKTIGLTSIKDNRGIQIACKSGVHRTGGKHLVTGERLHWMYLDEYNKLLDEEKQKLKYKYYTGNFLLPKNQKEVNNNDNK